MGAEILGAPVHGGDCVAHTVRGNLLAIYQDVPSAVRDWRLRNFNMEHAIRDEMLSLGLLSREAKRHAAAICDPLAGIANDLAAIAELAQTSAAAIRVATDVATPRYADGRRRTTGGFSFL